jgi:hypothetical protein
MEKLTEEKVQFGYSVTDAGCDAKTIHDFIFPQQSIFSGSEALGKVATAAIRARDCSGNPFLRALLSAQKRLERKARFLGRLNAPKMRPIP